MPGSTRFQCGGHPRTAQTYHQPLLLPAPVLSWASSGLLQGDSYPLNCTWAPCPDLNVFASLPSTLSPSHILPDNPTPLLLWRYFHYFNVLSSWVELWKHTGPHLSMVEEGSELGHPGLALSGLIQDKNTWFKYAKYFTTMLRTSLT